MSLIDVNNAKNPRPSLSILVQITGGGQTITYTEDDLIFCELDLRCDLRKISPTIPVSTITIKYRDTSDLTETLAKMKGYKITYSAGYVGDMSEERTFYISEATQSDYIVTITGEDSAAQLAKYPQEGIQTIEVTDQSGMYDLYQYAKSVLADGGIIPVHEEADPTYAAAYQSRYVIVRPSTTRERLADLINRSPVRFVDAGIPSLSITTPTAAAYTIPANFCGKIQRKVRSSIRELTCEDTYGVHCSLSHPGELVTQLVYLIAGDMTSTEKILTIEPLKEDGHYMYDYDVWQGYYSNGGIIHEGGQNPTIIAKNAERFVFIPELNSEDGPRKLLYVRGQKFRYSAINAVSVSGITDGESIEVETPIVGRFGTGEQQLVCLYPNPYRQLGVQITDEFTYRGDPRMQPMDIVNVGGKLETVENIILTHEGGGTSARLVCVEGII